ncbi:MAG: hypothetical protein QOH43_1794 [Solirubrobacteraceae bacterium]|jgi:hypothetical protein|nr:hypothetical protein [Solirubrobacteraceae bacterium]
MLVTAQTGALIVAGLNLLAGLSGGLLWWRVDPRRRWWLGLRGAQAAAAAYAVLAGVLYVAGYRPGNGLFWLYVLLPVPVAVVAEQLRLVSAQTVLDARGLEGAKAVGELPEDRQRSVVTAILRREMGVMALAALVVAFLALRAYVET